MSVIIFWNHIFDKESVSIELKVGGFSEIRFFNNVAGEKGKEESPEFCIYAKKI